MTHHQFPQRLIISTRQIRKKVLDRGNHLIIPKVRIPVRLQTTRSINTFRTMIVNHYHVKVLQLFRADDITEKPSKL